jgi:hypothetical protein
MKVEYSVLLHDTRFDTYKLYSGSVDIEEKEMYGQTIDRDYIKHLIRFDWLENNNSCDCNRSLKFYNDWDKELECSDSENIIDLIWVVDDLGDFIYKKGEEE